MDTSSRACSLVLGAKWLKLQMGKRLWNSWRGKSHALCARATLPFSGCYSTCLCRDKLCISRPGYKIVYTEIIVTTTLMKIQNSYIQDWFGTAIAIAHALRRICMCKFRLDVWHGSHTLKVQTNLTMIMMN